MTWAAVFVCGKCGEKYCAQLAEVEPERNVERCPYCNGTRSKQAIPGAAELVGEGTFRALKNNGYFVMWGEELFRILREKEIKRGQKEIATIEDVDKEIKTLKLLRRSLKRKLKKKRIVHEKTNH